MEIYILVGNKENYNLKKIEATELKVKSDLKFFYHSSLVNPNKITITEYSTGRFVLEIDVKLNPEKAFNDYIKKHPDFLDKIKKKMLKLPKIFHNK